MNITLTAGDWIVATERVTDCLSRPLLLPGDLARIEEMDGEHALLSLQRSGHGEKGMCLIPAESIQGHVRRIADGHPLLRLHRAEREARVALQKVGGVALSVGGEMMRADARRMLDRIASLRFRVETQVLVMDEAAAAEIAVAAEALTRQITQTVALAKERAPVYAR